MWSMYQSVVVKKELSYKAKLSIYRSIYVPTLTYGHDRKDKIPDTGGRNELSPQGAGRSLRDRVRSSVTREELRVEESAEVARASVPDASWTPSWGAVLGVSHREETPGKTLEGLCLPTGLGMPRCPPGGAGGCVSEREVWASLLRLLPPRPGPGPG